MAGWAAVVSRGALCSRLAPSDCHASAGSSSNGGHQSCSSDGVGRNSGSLRHSSRSSLRIGSGTGASAASCSSCSSSSAAAPALQIATRGSSQWGQAASVGAPPAAEAETPDETVATGGRRGVHVGQMCVQGLREDMEDDIIVQEAPFGFTYAGVFDGHAGFATTEFLRWVVPQPRRLQNNSTLRSANIISSS